MPEIEPKVIRQWKSPFRNENDVASRFQGHVAELLAQLGTIDEHDFSREIERLTFANRQYELWITKSSEWTNMFLAPAVEAASRIAGVLQKRGSPYLAFWVSNVFGEMCKILIGRRREKYEALFEDLLRTATYSISDSWRLDKTIQVVGNESGEISKLSTHLDNIILRSALGFYFSNKHGFVRTNRPDTDLGERLVNDAVARHFDCRLRDLLQHDLPRVQAYARLNMPFVFRIKLTEKWALEKRNEWKKLLSDAGYDETIRLLEDMGDLINPDEVGQVSLDTREEVMRAATSNDLERVSSLLSESAKELKDYLYREAQARLQYREPNKPHLIGDHQQIFAQAVKSSRTDDPDQIPRGLQKMQNIWQQNIHNLDLRDWVAFLQARTGNLPAAEKMLEENQKRRSPKHNFATDWNLAVLAYDRRNESLAYSLLIPLLESGNSDEDLIMVILALSLKLNDLERFLVSIPQTMSLKFHPLALTVAYQTSSLSRVEELLAQLLNQWQGTWQLPPMTKVFSKYEELEQTVNKAIVEGQVEQVVVWLEARIKHNKHWIPNYLELARLLETELQDFDKTFQILRRRHEQIKGKKPLNQRYVDDATRDLLDFCKRVKRLDLGKQAYQIAKGALAGDDLLAPFDSFRPNEVTFAREEDITPSTSSIPEAKPYIPSRDPGLSEQLAWANARLTSIGSVSSYIEEAQAISEFSKILVEISPHESSTVVELMKLTSGVIETFHKTAAKESDARRVLYERSIDSERRLSELLRSDALSQHMKDVITPYGQALKRVVGDLSRQVGVGPVIDVNIENAFISLEGDQTTLVLRVTNRSQHVVSDVLIELLVDTPSITVIGSRERKLDKLDIQKTRLFNFPIEHDTLQEMEEISFGLSLRASAEGFPNVDLGIKKQSISIKKFHEVVGTDRVPKLFQAGKPLNPADPALFQGRTDLLNQIEGSFHGGVQKERYFLDGIRRVGKTSILNFLSLSLPENVTPILINIEKLGITGRANSGSILYSICNLINAELAASIKKSVDVPDISAFELAPGACFDAFLSEIKVALPGHLPLLMIDEFQELLEAVARTGSAQDRDTVVLDQMRAHLEEGKLSALFTGSVRFDRLTSIIDHRIFGSLRRLRVSFLKKEGVTNVLRAGMDQWVEIPSVTIEKVYQLTGGYPWLIQTYGSELIDLVNQERRTIVTPEDVDFITNRVVLCNAELFKYWWSTDLLGIEEERFIERLFRNHQLEKAISTKEFFAEIHSTQRPAFNRAFENLRACEVLDSTQNDFLKFSGDVLRQWLQQQFQDGKLKIQSPTIEPIPRRGRVGIFVDHENLVRGLKRISERRGITVPTDKSQWFSTIFEHLWKEIERRFGKVNHHKVAVAFWSRPNEAVLLTPYFAKGFRPSQPEDIKEHAADFMLADEIRREKEKAVNEGTTLDDIVIVGADADFAQSVRALKNDGVNVQVWGGSKDIKQQYVDIIGEEKFVALDDVCGL